MARLQSEVQNGSYFKGLKNRKFGAKNMREVINSDRILKCVYDMIKKFFEVKLQFNLKKYLFKRKYLIKNESLSNKVKIDIRNFY